MGFPAELYPYAAFGAVVAGLIIGAIGYLMKRAPQSNGATSTSIRGAAIIDSGAAFSLTEVLDRLVEAQNRTADALEKEAKEMNAIASMMRNRDEMEARRDREQEVEEVVRRKMEAFERNLRRDG